MTANDERPAGDARPAVDSAALARRNRRTALVLGLLALLIYGYYILRQVLASEGGGQG